MLSFCCLLRFFWGFWGFFCRRRRRCCCLIYFWKRNLMMRLRYTLHTRGRSHKYLPAEQQQQQQQHLKHYWTRTSKIVERETEEAGEIGREKEALSVCRCFSYYLSNLSRSACCAACQCRSNMCILLEYFLWYFLFFFFVKSLQRLQWAKLLFSSKRSIRN